MRSKEDATNRHPVSLYRWGFAIALTAITYLALAPQDFPATEGVSDKLNHFAAFLTLSWLADFSWPGSSFNLKKISALLGYGILLEIIQWTLPHRMFSLLDIGADLLGIAAYIGLVTLLKKIPSLKPRWRQGSS